MIIVYKYMRVHCKTHKNQIVIGTNRGVSVDVCLERTKNAKAPNKTHVTNLIHVHPLVSHAPTTRIEPGSHYREASVLTTETAG